MCRRVSPTSTLSVCLFVKWYDAHGAAFPVVCAWTGGGERGGGGMSWSKVFWGKSISMQSDKASGTPLPEYIPELNLCIVATAMMSVSVIMETARGHTHTAPPRLIVSSLFIVQTSLLVVQEALPFCADIAFVSSKCLCSVHWRTCGKKTRNNNQSKVFYLNYILKSCIICFVSYPPI